MNPLLLVLPYCQKDAELLSKNLNWMGELLPDYRPHSCLLVADHQIPHDEKQRLQQLARPMFAHTETMIVRIKSDDQHWPIAANIMFASAARQIAETYKLPWFWCEPDAVPLRANWLNELAREYSVCAKRFMGALIPSTGQPNVPPVHLAGCAVYDTNAYIGLKPFTETPRAFDIAAAPYTVPRAISSPLMQHFWGKPGLSPTFRTIKGSEDPENTIPFGWLRPDACIMHRCKDGSLIDLLRERRNALAIEEAQQKLSVAPSLPCFAEPPKRGPGRPRKNPPLEIAAKPDLTAVT